MRKEKIIYFCDRVRCGSSDGSNYCLSSVSWSTVHKYYRGRYLLVSHGDRGSIWLPKPPGDCFRSRILLFSLSCCQLGFGGLLSLMSINSTAALSPPRAALPSQCPTPSSFPSVCTDPRGPRLPPRARHGPTSIDISAGLHWWAERAAQNGPEPSDIFWEGSGNRGRNSDGKWVLNDYQLFCMF